jgi:hypothetical protein
VGCVLASEGNSKPISVEDERLGENTTSVEDGIGLARRKC